MRGGLWVGGMIILSNLLETLFSIISRYLSLFYAVLVAKTHTIELYLSMALRGAI